MKLLVRLSKPGVKIPQLLKLNHGLTGPVNNWGTIKGAEFYYGIAFTGEPGWVSFAQSGTQSQIKDLKNRGVVGLIFIPLKRRYIVFSFGMSIKSLSPSGFERDFGLKVVLNTVNPKKIKSIDSKIIDTVIVNKRTQLSKENKFEDFGLEINKDLLRAVVGIPDNERFASLVAGSDTLAINVDISLKTFRKKCNEILDAYNSSKYKRNYRWVDNIKPIKDLQVISSLEAQLIADLNSVLGGAHNMYFQLASPDIVDFSQVDHFRFRGYRSKEVYPLPNFEDLTIDLISNSITSLTTGHLESIHIEAVDGNGSAVGSKPLKQWLIAEIRHGNDSYILSEGEWFKIDRRYFNSIEKTFVAILKSKREFEKIGTTSHGNESLYITNYKAKSNEKIFDKLLAYTYGKNNSLEICDIYNSSRQFIHIKDSGVSSKLSHLFNQGYVSALTFVSDPAFRKEMKTKLNKKPLLQKTIPNRVTPQNFTVVFRILKHGPAFSLPFFTKVVINEMYKKIKLLGFRFKLEWVEKV